MGGYFNPRSPHGERQTRFWLRKPTEISTHAPRTGSDATGTNPFSAMRISTHAPRTGSDTIRFKRQTIANDFNPRSPHGERRLLSLLPRPSCEKFQPTLPARGATAGSKSVFYALLYFNPRSPHGERRSGTRREKSRARFQPTLPARGATLRIQPSCTTGRDFNPRSPHGERLNGEKKANGAIEFQPTLPARGATCVGAWCLLGLLISTHAPRTGSDRVRIGLGTADGISTHAPRTGSD